MVCKGIWCKFHYLNFWLPSLLIHLCRHVSRNVGDTCSGSCVSDFSRAGGCFPFFPKPGTSALICGIRFLGFHVSAVISLHMNVVLLSAFGDFSLYGWGFVFLACFWWGYLILCVMGELGVCLLFQLIQVFWTLFWHSVAQGQLSSPFMWLE